MVRAIEPLHVGHQEISSDPNASQETLPPLIKPQPPAGSNGASPVRQRADIPGNVETADMDATADSFAAPASATPHSLSLRVRLEPLVVDGVESGQPRTFQVRCSNEAGEQLLMHPVSQPEAQRLGDIRVRLAARLDQPQDGLRLELPSGQVSMQGDGSDEYTLAHVFPEFTDVVVDPLAEPSNDPLAASSTAPLADEVHDEPQDAAPEEPPAKLKPRRTLPEHEEECDTAEMALMARLGGGDFEDRGRRKEITFSQAVDKVVWALDINERGVSGVAEKATVVPWTLISRFLSISALVIIVSVFLTSMTRASFKEVSVSENGLLLAHGVPSYEGEEPIAATAEAIEVKELRSCSGLSEQTLRHLKDVELVHEGVWRSIRVTRMVKFSDSHLWLEAPDGTGLRIQFSSVFIRQGKLGDEQRVVGGRPLAYFDVVASS